MPPKSRKKSQEKSPEREKPKEKQSVRGLRKKNPQESQKSEAVPFSLRGTARLTIFFRIFYIFFGIFPSARAEDSGSCCARFFKRLPTPLRPCCNCPDFLLFPPKLLLFYSSVLSLFEKKPLTAILAGIYPSTPFFPRSRLKSGFFEFIRRE